MKLFPGSVFRRRTRSRPIVEGMDTETPAKVVKRDGYVVSINLARSWTRWQGLAVTALIAAQALLVALLPLSSTAGVLTFNVLTAGVTLGLQTVILTLGFARPHWVRWS